MHSISFYLDLILLFLLFNHNPPPQKKLNITSKTQKYFEESHPAKKTLALVSVVVAVVVVVIVVVAVGKDKDRPPHKQ